jgi:hypothetical protein
VCPCEPAEQLLRQRLDELDAEMARLRELRRDLVAMTTRIPAGDCPQPTPGTWTKESTKEVTMSCECCDDPTCECC